MDWLWIILITVGWMVVAGWWQSEQEADRYDHLDDEAIKRINRMKIERYLDRRSKEMMKKAWLKAWED